MAEQDEKAPKKPRGKPFAKGEDQRRNTSGVSKEDAAAKSLARSVAQAVLAEELQDGDTKRTRLELIFKQCAIAAQRDGAGVNAEFLMKWAYGRPPEDAPTPEETVGGVLWDIASSVMKRPIRPTEEE